MAWLRLILDSDREHAGCLTDLLERFGAASISFPDPGGRAPRADDGRGETTRISALLHEDVDLDTLLVCLRGRPGAERIRQHRLEVLEDGEEAGGSREGYGTLRYGGKMCIRPVWCGPPADGDDTLMLEPGLVFGSGAHATTALCLDWLAGRDLAGQRVIDYGCGSGVLALSALRLGAEHAWAVDTDPLALEVSRRNAERNCLLPRITIGHPDAMARPRADILLANLHLDPLRELAATFAGLLLPGGTVVLSGLLATQVAGCLAVYETWFTMHSPIYRREWALVQGEKRPPNRHRQQRPGN